MKELKTIIDNWDSYNRALAYTHLLKWGVIFAYDYGDYLEPYGTIEDVEAAWEDEVLADIESRTWGGNYIIGAF